MAGRLLARLANKLPAFTNSLPVNATTSIVNGFCGLKVTEVSEMKNRIPFVFMNQFRTVFAEVKPKVNLQIHTHDKYKKVNPQPTYDWMVGRFIVDRNNVIWHRQANRSTKRYSKTAGALNRLKRWKPLHSGFAKKLLKLGFKRRYWMDPNPQDVPGFSDSASYVAPKRHSGKVNSHPYYGCPSLRQSARFPDNKHR